MVDDARTTGRQNATVHEIQDEMATTTSEMSRRKSHGNHSYGQVTLNHSNAHLGDFIQHNNYYTLDHRRDANIAAQIDSFDEERLVEIGVFFFFIHTCSQLPGIYPSIGLFTWYGDMELSSPWIRIGAAATLTKYIVLLGLALWDKHANNGEVILKPHPRRFFACWMTLTLINLPRTFIALHMLEELAGLIHGLRTLMHIFGEIAEYLIGCRILWQGWDGETLRLITLC